MDETRIDALLARMSLEQLAGQVMAIGFDGAAPEPEMIDMIEQYGVGGAVFFARNVVSPAQVARLSNALQSAARNTGQPGLMLSIDQEGGRVARLTEDCDFTEFPSAMALGAAGDPENARRTARAIAREMLAVGLNADLAPVLDINSNTGNPVIGTRAFGFDPELVARCGVAFIEGLQAEGVLAFGKHFPGHGDTGLDSHVILPVVEHDRARLEAVEFVPFRAAMQAGVGALMVAHVNFRAIEPGGLPGTISPRVMTGLLRGEMGYGGLLATDSLEMGALAESGYPVPLAAALALQAGADLLLFNRDHALHRAAHAEIVAWVQAGKIPLARLKNAARNVLAAKARFGMLDPQPADPERAAEVCGAADHRRLAREVCRQAIRRVPGQVTLPLRAAALVAPPGTEALAARLGWPALPAPENPTPAEIETLLSELRAGPPEAVVVPLLDAAIRAPGQLELLRALHAAGLPAAAVALRSPFDLDGAPPGVTGLATYGSNPPALDALAAVLRAS